MNFYSKHRRLHYYDIFDKKNHNNLDMLSIINHIKVNIVCKLFYESLADPKYVVLCGAEELATCPWYEC